jgi:peptide methionine sulfoxide reductase MsrA
VETYCGPVAFGLDRPTDERTVIYVLQKLSDDRLMEVLVKRLSDQELEEIYSFATRLLKSHLQDEEYHELFLKEAHP